MSDYNPIYTDALTYGDTTPITYTNYADTTLPPYTDTTYTDYSDIVNYGDSATYPELLPLGDPVLVPSLNLGSLAENMMVELRNLIFGLIGEMLPYILLITGVYIAINVGIYLINNKIGDTMIGERLMSGTVAEQSDYRYKDGEFKRYTHISGDGYYEDDTGW